MDDWTVGAFSDSLEEKVKKLNLYRIPEFPKDTFIKPRKRAEYWPPHMVPSNQLQKLQESTNENNNSVTSSTQNNKTAVVISTGVANNINTTETKNKFNHSMNTSSNEAINDFILVELVILLITNFTLVFFLLTNINWEIKNFYKFITGVSYLILILVK